MEKIIDTKEFLELLKKRERKIVYRKHAIKQAKERNFIHNSMETIPIFESDISRNTPYLIVEQTCETPEHSQFKVYYNSPLGGYSVYILILNDEMFLRSVYRTTKNLQKKIFKIERSKIK